MPAGLHLKVAGYLKSNKITEPDVDDVMAAIEFLKENPDYKSDTQKTRSESGSVDEKPKARGRPKKVKTDDEPQKPAPKVVAPQEEESEDEAEEEVEEAEEAEAFEMPNFSNLTHKGVDYLLDDEENEVFTADGEMKWMGTWNGKKIVLGEKSERVKKIIAAAE
jgi:hypothetical protein